jgi:hypothetical protein
MELKDPFTNAGSGVGTGSLTAPYAQITQNHEPVRHPLVGLRLLTVLDQVLSLLVE